MPRATPDVALVASTARSQELKERGSDKNLVVVIEPLVAKAPLRKRAGEMLVHTLAPGLSENQNAVNGALDVSLLGAAVGGSRC